MFMMKGALALFISLAMGYVLCVLANKQKKGLLQTVGYTLGTAIIALSLFYGVAESLAKTCENSMQHGNKGMMKCHAGTFARGQVK